MMKQKRKGVTVSTRQYDRSHMAPPRGRRGWLFELWDLDRDQLVEACWAPPGGSMTYTQARKAAVAKARELGCDLVEVLP